MFVWLIYFLNFTKEMNQPPNEHPRSMCLKQVCLPLNYNPCKSFYSKVYHLKKEPLYFLKDTVNILDWLSQAKA